MSRVAKWKLEKAKIKVVFRLQFHATHIPQAGWDKLFISFIPADTGKATAKTTKTNVRNGACKWADPIYETTRLLQDSKSKQYDEKLYKFVVAMGSSRSSILGEATINLADYADALKPSIVALPLQGCNSGTILHVTVQLLTSKTGFREFEQQRELRERGLQTGADMSRHDVFCAGKVSSSEEVNARVKFRPESKELPSLEEEAGLTEEYADSAIGLDGSSNTSESLYAEKHDVSSAHEIESQKSTVSGDLTVIPNCQSPVEEKKDISDGRILAQGSSDWVHGWSSDFSMDNDLAIAYEENNRLRGSLDVAESSVLGLKLEISSLQSLADEIGVGTQKFAQQLADETASGEKLAKEVSIMRAECSKLKGDMEQLKSLKLSTQYANKVTSSINGGDLFQGIQLRLLNGLFVLEDKIRDLQNKMYLGFHDRDLRLLYTDLEALLIVLQELKQGAQEANSLVNLPSEMINVQESREVSSHGNEQLMAGQGLDVDLYQPPDMLHCLSIPNMVSQGSDSLGAMEAMKGQIFELLRELDEAKGERESLTRKMDQMECYYEALVQELEENQKQMLGELQNLRNEHSTCMYTIATKTAEIESMRQDMSEQILRFTEERCELESINKELERRAVTSEASLRRARLNYSIAVDQLQKDLDLLSFQVLSMFETNENLIKQTFSEPSQLCLQGPQDAVRNLEESDASKLRQFQNQNAEVNKQVMGGDILLEDMKKSLLLQEGLYQKIEEELSEMQVVNLSLDVFSKILQEILLEASLGIIQMEKKTDELEQQLDLAIESKKLFGLQLQTAMDEIQTLNEYKAGCVAKCSDMALQNQTLEAKLVGLSNENVLLMQKTTEQEALLIECRSYESKYQVCSSEKMELTDLLKQETSNRSNLQNEIFSLKEELKAIKAECGELASSKENLQEIVGLVDDKLRSLLVSYNEQLNGLYPLTSSLHRDTSNLKSVLSQLEEIQHNACEKILQLLEEKKNLVDERDLAQSSSSTANAEILVAKQKFKHDIQSMAANLEASNTLLAKLQLELETLTSKLYNCSEAEERYTQRNEELSADLTVLEVELQQLTSKNMDLAKEILSLDTINIELERSKLTIADLAEERQNLLTSLQDKSHESITLASELDSLKESMRFLHDELQVERSLRENLESHVSDLTSQLNEKHDHLLRFSNQEAELLHFRQLASDLELEKSQISHILLQHEECLGKLRDESSCLTDLENQLSEMHKHVVAADVKVVFFGMEYETRMEEVGLKLQSSQRDLFELHRKLSDVEVMLNHSLAGEAHYVEENVNLQKSIESLRLELEASVAQQGVLSDLNHHMALQMEEYEKRIAELELNFSNDKTEHSVEVEQLKHKLMLYVEEIDDHIFSKEELEITLVVLKAKLDELHAHNTLLGKYNEEILMLQEHCKELTRKLSEQILKTEEFKNLSIHLKELKDKAEAESVHVHEKREPEGPQVAVQESLRIAFIKEQCETKVQELKQQLSISQKHGEELLWKLQDAVDELENRKKSEASHLKRNEELSLKILELEADLQSVVSEKREKIKAYDCIKTELECAQLSFECCKEEKQRLEASLLECSEENNRVATELILIKGQLESSVSPMYIHKEESNGSDDLGYISGDTVIRQACKDYTVQDPSIKESITTDVAENGSTERSLECSTQQILVNCEEIQDTCSSPIVDTERQTRSVNVQPSKDALVPKSMHAGTKHAFVEQGTLRHNDLKQLSVINDHFRNQSLRSTMDHLHKELERMKNENSLLTMDDLHIDPNFQGLQTELMQLNKANEELRSIFPLFDEIPDSGNALERVLALEIELAEALRAKKKSSGLFQSSFLKQHSDEQAILQSFRNINELIKEMLELKGRHAAVETELKGMHARYSQLSLRFAEVEGERQKLTMTLKNVRSMSKKPMQSSDSSPATPGDY